MMPGGRQLRFPRANWANFCDSFLRTGFYSGKSKRGPSKWGLGPKGANRASKGPFFRNFPETPTPSTFPKYCRGNGRRTAIQMGGVLQYKWEVYCWVSLSSKESKPRSQEGTAIRMGGVLPCKLEVYCSTFSKTSRGWGFRNSSDFWGISAASPLSMAMQK